MINEILAFAAGLFLAWCSFQAIGRVWGRLFVLLLFVPSSAFAAIHVKFNNNTGGTSSAYTSLQFRHNGGSWVSFNTFRRNGSCEDDSSYSGQTGNFKASHSSANWNTGTYDFRRSDTGATLGTLTYPSGVTSVGSPCFYDISNDRYNLEEELVEIWTLGQLCVTNTEPAIADFCLLAYADVEIPVFSNVGPLCAKLNPGESYCWGPFTNLFPFGVSIIGPGSITNDYQPRVWAGGVATPEDVDTAPSGGESGPPEGPTQGSSPVDQVPTHGTNSIPGSAIDTREADRQNTEYLARVFGAETEKQTRALTNALAQLDLDVDLTNNVSVTNNISLTNNFDLGWTNILLRIETNTAHTATNTVMLTNQIAGHTISNALNTWLGAAGAAIGDATNDFAASALGGLLADGIEAVEDSTIEQDVSSSSDIFKVDLETMRGTYHLNFDLFSARSGADEFTHSGLRSSLLSWANWLRGWILKLIPFVAWWLFTRKLFEFAHEVSVRATEAVKNPESAPWSMIGRAAGLVMIAVLAGLVAAVPVALVARMEGMFMAAEVPSIAEHIEDAVGSGSTWAFSAARYFVWLGELIPFGTLIFALVHYLAFDLYGRELLASFIWALRAFKWIVWGVVLVVNVEAGQVRVLNLTTNSVQITNEFRSLSVPPGDFFFNLEENHDWGVVGAGPVAVVDPDEAQNDVVLRIARDAIGDLVIDQAFSGGVYAAFFLGYQVGFVFFGVAYWVTSIRSGMNAAARSGLPD